MIVLKIGGSCLNNLQSIDRVIEIVREWENNNEKPVLVLSAFNGVTDQLISLIDHPLDRANKVLKLKKTHILLLSGLSREIHSNAVEKIESLFDELNEELNKITESKKFSLEDRDRIVTVGEKLSTIIIEAHMLNNGFKCKSLWGFEAGIITNNRYIMEESYAEIKNKLNQDFVPVVAGYFGHDKKGKITTLGRGASDYIATSISAALECPVFLYKDVDGIMTADPKMVERPSIIKKISYKDALELSFFGAKVINEKAILPCAAKNIQINVQNFYKNEAGTIISDSGKVNAVCVIADGLKVDLYNFSIMKNEINEVFKEINASRLLPRLVLMTGRSEICFIIRKNEMELVNRFLAKKEGIMDVAIQDVGLVTFIGDAANSQDVNQINDYLIKNNLSYYLMTQSPSKNIISFIMDKIHIEKMAGLLHNLFVER